MHSSDTPAATDSKEQLCVLVPCLDEERRVGPTVEAILDLAAELPLPVRVILIDDGSRDGTRAQMESLCHADERCRMRTNERNLGLGRSVLAAYEDVPAGSWVSVIPGDNEFDVSSLARFLAVRRDHDLILGYFQNPVIRPFGRRMASDLFTKVVNLLYGFEFRYLNGLKLYRVECFRDIEMVSGGHAFNAELVAKALLRRPDLRVGEVPFIARGRAGGTSKALRPLSVLGAVRDVWAGLRSVAAYRARIIRGGVDGSDA